MLFPVLYLNISCGFLKKSSSIFISVPSNSLDLIGGWNGIILIIWDVCILSLRHILVSYHWYRSLADIDTYNIRVTYIIWWTTGCMGLKDCCSRFFSYDVDSETLCLYQYSGHTALCEVFSIWQSLRLGFGHSRGTMGICFAWHVIYGIVTFHQDNSGSAWNLLVLSSSLILFPCAQSFQVLFDFKFIPSFFLQIQWNTTASALVVIWLIYIYINMKHALHWMQSWYIYHSFS